MDARTVTITHKPSVRETVTYGKCEDDQGTKYNLTAFARVPLVRKRIESAPVGTVLHVEGEVNRNAKGDRQIIVERITEAQETTTTSDDEPVLKSNADASLPKAIMPTNATPLTVTLELARQLKAEGYVQVRPPQIWADDVWQIIMPDNVALRSTWWQDPTTLQTVRLYEGNVYKGRAYAW